VEPNVSAELWFFSSSFMFLLGWEYNCYLTGTILMKHIWSYLSQIQLCLYCFAVCICL